MNTLAIDVGGTKFSVAGFTDDGIAFCECRSTDREGGPEWMCGEIARIVERCKNETGFVADAAGIGFGGPVDFKSQTITMSTHVAGWQSFPLLDRIERIAGVRPVVDNDANVGALGEYLYGAGDGADPFFYMTLSTGIGGGIIWNGEVYRGADSFGGELGHLTIVPDGPECLCGSHGCYERMCCGLWLERDYGRPARVLFEDEEFVRRYVVHLARGLKAAIMILNPARIVIGGGIANSGDRLFVPLRSELRRQITSWSRARIDVLPARLGDNSVLYGAWALARKEKE